MVEPKKFYIKGIDGYLTSLKRLTLSPTLHKEKGSTQAVAFETREDAQAALDALDDTFEKDKHKFQVVEE